MGKFSAICACRAHPYRINHDTHTPTRIQTHNAMTHTHTQPELATQAKEGERADEDDEGTNSQKSVDIVLEL